MTLKKLTAKQVLVTGAGSGIGLATVLAFAKQGANIIATDICSESLEKVKTQVTALGVNCLTFKSDVSNADDVKALSLQVFEQVGAIDILVNNAGIGYMGAFADNTLEHWPKVLDVNLMGVVHGCHYFLSQMLTAGGPRHIVNVSSSVGNFPGLGMSAYVASKYAVKGFSEALRMELWETPVKVITVHPGVIKTAIVNFKNNNINNKITEEQIDNLQTYYKDNGCSPDVVANDIVNAVINNKLIVNTGPGAALMNNLQRLSISLTRKLSIYAAKKMAYWV